MNHALIAGTDMTGAEEFAVQLHKLGWRVLYADEVRPLWTAGVPVVPMQSIVSDPLSDSRYALFSQEVYAGLTVPCDDPVLRQLGMPYIDLLCTNLAPLRKTESGDDLSVHPAAIAGIGNLSLIQHAIYGGRMVVTEPELYPSIASWLKEENRPDENHVRRLMWKVALWECLRYSAASFGHFAGYPRAIDIPYNWQKEINPEAEFHYEYDPVEGPVQILRNYLEMRTG